MNIHKNARLTPHSRAELARRVIEEGQAPKAVATAFGVSDKTVNKWVRRFKAEGLAGMQDRSSRPHQLCQPTPATTVERIAELRRQRWTGDQIAREVGVSPATVSRVLQRLAEQAQGLEPAEPVRRYERENPGEFIPHRHQKARPLRQGRSPHHRRSDRPKQYARHRLEFVHVCIDDHSRVAFAQIMPTERKECAIAFLKAAIAYYQRLGVTATTGTDLMVAC